jgi:hypothetical protein
MICYLDKYVSYIPHTYICMYSMWVNVVMNTVSSYLYTSSHMTMPVHNSMMTLICRMSVSLLCVGTVTAQTSVTEHNPTFNSECGYEASVGCNKSTGRVDHRDIRVPDSLSRNLISNFWNVVQRSNVSTPSAEETFGIFRTGNDSYYLDLDRVCRVIILQVYQLTPTSGKIVQLILCLYLPHSSN